MNLGLQGKVAVVAAASQGLGKAAAVGLVREGASVIVCARDRKRLLASAKEISRWVRGTKQAVIPVVADLRKGRDIARVVAAAVRNCGRLDILITNAGGPPAGTFPTLDDEKWSEGFTLTLLSVIRLVRAALPYMQKRKWGRIINITSLTARQPVTDLAVSSAIRPAVTGLAKVLANQFGRDGITVNNVAPGYIRTARQVELSRMRAAQRSVTEEEYVADLSREVPLGRLGEPGEVADAIVFLASERSGYISGITLSVDGGLVKGI